jgi:YHS domain-containing protein
MSFDDIVFGNSEEVWMTYFNLKTLTKAMLGFLMAAFLVVVFATAMNAEPLKKKINSDIFGVAIKGYDTVAYFTQGRAMKGKSEFSYDWNDAKWYFATAENRDLFAADPEHYAPKYGGYWAASLASTGKVVGVNPEAFKIIDGKLYLNWSLEVSNKFAKNSDESIKKADENWAKLNQ